MTTPYTTAELGLEMHEEFRKLRFENAAYVLAIRLALKHLKRNEVAQAERILKEAQ